MTKLLRLKPASLLLAAMILLLAFGNMSFAQGGRYSSPDAWAFGVHGDTQWTLHNDSGNELDPANLNPEWVNASAIGKINAEMIRKNVKFVLPVGDLTDRTGVGGFASRPTVAGSC